MLLASCSRGARLMRRRHNRSTAAGRRRQVGPQRPTTFVTKLTVAANVQEENHFLNADVMRTSRYSGIAIRN